LLGYTLDDGVRLIYLEAVGPHENFYRDLEEVSVMNLDPAQSDGLPL
jgi:hypothetical protein